MRGVHLGNGNLTLRDDLPPLVARAGWTRVRVLRAGICATDLALRRGYMGFSGTPGHEFVGLALEGALAGKRVVGEINAGCGECESCRLDSSRHCPRRTVLGILAHSGAFAEELMLPTRNLHVVPESVSTAAALFVEPLAAAFRIQEQVPLRRGMTALVAGDGKLGLLCAHVLALHGLAVTVAGRHPERQDLLPSSVHLDTRLWSLTPTEHPRFDLAVEATGHGEVLERLLAFVRPRGTLVLKTTCEGGTPLNLSMGVVDEITIVGSRCGPFAPALACLADGKVPVERMVAAVYPLRDAEAAFAHAGRRGTLKVVLEG